MSRIRLYLDEDVMRKSITGALRSHGLDVLTALEAGMINRPDEDHLVLAANSGRALYSFNVADYCVRHERWLGNAWSHSGIIVAPQQRYSIGQELQRLTHLVDRLNSGEMANRLEFLSSW